MSLICNIVIKDQWNSLFFSLTNTAVSVSGSSVSQLFPVLFPPKIRFCNLKLFHSNRFTQHRTATMMMMISCTCDTISSFRLLILDLSGFLEIPNPNSLLPGTTNCLQRISMKVKERSTVTMVRDAFGFCYLHCVICILEEVEAYGDSNKNTPGRMHQSSEGIDFY